MKTYKAAAGFLVIFLIGIATLILPQSVYGAVARVTDQKTGTAVAAASTTLAMPNNVTAGNNVVVVTSTHRSGSYPSNTVISKSSGTATIGTVTNSTRYQRYDGYYYKILAVDVVPITGTGSLTLSVSATNAAGLGIAVNEYSGLGAVDGTPVSNTGDGTSESTGNISGHAGGLMISMSTETGPATVSYTNLSDTLVYSNASNSTKAFLCQDRLVGSDETHAITNTVTDSIWAEIGVAFLSSTKANGESCSVGGECTSTYCVDSTCCATSSCTGTCKTCGSASHSGAGTCDYIGSATDPDSECGALDCHTGETKYYDSWSSYTCYYKADISAANAVCTGTSAACKTAADMCPSSTQGSSASTATVCNTMSGCTGTTAGTTGNVTADTDPNVGCASYSCTSKVYGWSDNDCKAAAATSHDGMCNGSGACYTTFADSCTSGGSTLASCGSAGCKNASACVQDSASTTSDTVGEICYTSGQHACSSGQECNATGSCVLPACANIPLSGDHMVTGSCAFPETVNGVDAGTGTTNTAKLTIGSVGTPGYLTVLAGQTLAAGSIELVNGSITIIKGTPGGTIKPHTPLYLPDADGDGYPTAVTTTQYTSAATGRARRNLASDTNDSQKCADADIPSTSDSAMYLTTCKKCVGGGLTNQTDAEDVYTQCTASYNACSGNTPIGPDGYCDGAGACKTTGQTGSACTTAGTCQTGGGCSGGSCVSVSNVAAGSDPNNQCAPYGCTSEVYGWSSLDCKAAAAGANDGDCNGAGACYTSFADSCTTGGSTLASCGSAGCQQSSVCVQDSASTTSDTVGEICYTSLQHSCSTGYTCNATGTCTSAGIAVDGTASTGKAATTPITVSHTTGSGDNRLMLVGVSGVGTGVTITGVTYGGVSLGAAVGTALYSTYQRVSIYKLVAPTSGTANVVVTFSANPNYGAIVGVMTFTGVNQSTPLGTFAGATGTSTTPSVNVTSATGELVFDTVSHWAALTATTGQTQRWSTGQTDVYGGGSTKPGAASVTMSWTAGGSDSWAIGAVPIKP